MIRAVAVTIALVRTAGAGWAEPAATETPTTDPATAAPPAAEAPAGPLITDEEEGPPKLSLPTEADRQAWRRPGFRLFLGASYGELHGLGGAPSGRLLGPTLRLGVRLDETWSIAGSFVYASASRAGALSGLRYAGTIDPTWHVTPSVSLAFGVGFGGIVEGVTGRVDAGPLPDEIESSYTFPDASTPVARCSGAGATGLVRGEWALVLGPRSQLAIAAEVLGQWTACVDDTGRIEPDSGDAIVRRQFWPHVGASLTAGVTWR
jgi:hypothetical protein